MKHSVRVKIFSVLLCVMLSVSLAVVHTSAADLSADLVGYWNFDGATAEEQLADKSTGGKVADNLEMGGDLLTIKDGVAHVPQDKGNYLLVNKSDDISDLSNATLFFKLKMTGVHTGTNAGEIFKAGNVTRTFYWPSAVIQSWCYGSANYKLQNTEFKYDTAFDGDFYYAMTIESANGKTTFALYLSRDGKTYEKSDATFDSGNNVLSNYITFGKTEKNTDARGIDFYFDEIRIYNRALSADEIAGLASSPVSVDTTAAPVTTTLPAVTTTAPAQTPATHDMMSALLLCAAAAVITMVVAKKRT